MTSTLIHDRLRELCTGPFQFPLPERAPARRHTRLAKAFIVASLSFWSPITVKCIGVLSIYAAVSLRRIVSVFTSGNSKTGTWWIHWKKRIRWLDERFLAWEVEEALVFTIDRKIRKGKNPNSSTIRNELKTSNFIWWHMTVRRPDFCNPSITAGTLVYRGRYGIAEIALNYSL